MKNLVTQYYKFEEAKAYVILTPEIKDVHAYVFLSVNGMNIAPNYQFGADVLIAEDEDALEDILHYAENFRINPVQKSLPEQIVSGILNDLRDRRGLSYEWDSIDDGIQEEIKDSWKDVVRKALLERGIQFDEAEPSLTEEVDSQALPTLHYEYPHADVFVVLSKKIDPLTYAHIMVVSEQKNVLSDFGINGHIHVVSSETMASLLCDWAESYGVNKKEMTFFERIVFDVVERLTQHETFKKAWQGISREDKEEILTEWKEIIDFGFELDRSSVYLAHKIQKDLMERPSLASVWMKEEHVIKDDILADWSKIFSTYRL